MLEGSSSFLKERTKKLSRMRARSIRKGRSQNNQKFFASFFQKSRPVFLLSAFLVIAAADEPAKLPVAAHTEQVPPERASGILGAAVTGPDGQDLGRIIDVLVDDSGKPRAAVIDFGGFFGMGSRKVAVSWSNLHFSPASANGMLIKLDLTADQIKAAPAYADSKPAAVVVAKPAPK
jgi:hypothetical protein